ncbi:MAG: 6-phosphofructokinase [Oscillospiraceae bacterium]|nr:6-phosphofructokinase [Oscillospiraceae bacterium]MDY4192134.1 6-phosphofructokinase [Oscillospiraceae bacterium]
MKNMLIAQSGGPTAAINASLSGAVQEAIRSREIDRVYGALNGIQGILKRTIIDLKSQFSRQEDFFALECTPAMALGSCRFRLPDPESAEGRALFENILETFRLYDIGYFFYIGGNDSMDTVYKLSLFFQEVGEDIRVMGIPKTIDNDLPLTDHTPGFGSAAKFISTAMLEIIRDCNVYDTHSVTIVEIMGRHAGWLTAAAALPRTVGARAPQLIYLPEVPFDPEQFLKDVAEVQKITQNCIVAVSEGVRLANGSFVAEDFQSGLVDAFGHRYLSGVGKYLENLVRDRIGCKVRSIELNVLQRCSSHLMSATDLNEARRIGSHAVRHALAGDTGRVMVMERVSNRPYLINIGLGDVSRIANREQLVPREWINKAGNDVTGEMFEYLLPLIEGEVAYPTLNGMPQHFLLNTELAPPPGRE